MRGGQGSAWQWAQHAPPGLFRHALSPPAPPASPASCRAPPPHLSPFVAAEEEGYLPEYGQQLKQLQVGGGSGQPLGYLCLCRCSLLCEPVCWACCAGRHGCPPETPPLRSTPLLPAPVQEAARAARKRRAGALIEGGFLEEGEGAEGGEGEGEGAAGEGGEPGDELAAAERRYAAELAKELKVGAWRGKVRCGGLYLCWAMRCLCWVAGRQAGRLAGTAYVGRHCTAVRAEQQRWSRALPRPLSPRPSPLPPCRPRSRARARARGRRRRREAARARRRQRRRARSAGGAAPRRRRLLRAARALRTLPLWPT